jgi:hypothetical protein
MTIRQRRPRFVPLRSVRCGCFLLPVLRSVRCGCFLLPDFLCRSVCAQSCCTPLTRSRRAYSTAACCVLHLPARVNLHVVFTSLLFSSMNTTGTVPYSPRRTTVAASVAPHETERLSDALQAHSSLCCGVGRHGLGRVGFSKKRVKMQMFIFIKYTYIYFILMNTSKKLSWLDLKIHKISHPVDRNVIFHSKNN